MVRVPEQPRGLLPDAAVPSFQHPPGLHGDEEVPEIDSLAEPPCQPPFPHAGDKDEHDVGASAGVVLSQGPQPVVEGAPAQGQALAHHAEVSAVVEGDGGIEAAPAVELHTGSESVDAGGHRGGESVDAGHRVHPAQKQREPLPGHGVGPHEVRGSVEAEKVGSLSDALGRQMIPLARRQVCRAVADPPDDALGQQVGQVSVDRGVGLAEDVRQLRRVDEGRSAESVEQLSFGKSQVGVLTPSLGRISVLPSETIAQLPLSPRSAPGVMPCKPLCQGWLCGNSETCRPRLDRT